MGIMGPQVAWPMKYHLITKDQVGMAAAMGNRAWLQKSTHYPRKEIDL